MIYRNVEFYEASDGHYIGESGNVEIRLNENEEDLDYSKSSKSEWCEKITSEIQVLLTEKEVQFIKDKVLNINGEEGATNTNYKQDCILTDEEEGFVTSIEEKIENSCINFIPDIFTMINCTDWYVFSTNEIDKKIKFKGNSLIIQIQNEYYDYKNE